ncbi:MAG TPA: hypothetical protein VGH28_09125 [Polyangiaceae bacterium]|jgi:hypothetical protein
MKRTASVAAASALFFFAGAASADSATIAVGGNYATPPPVVVVRDETPQPTIFVHDRDETLPKDPYRSPFRLTIGPAAITSGQGIGPGLMAAADFGSGAVGLRLSGAWFRGDAADDPNARFGARVGLYAGELTLDLHEAGPLHFVTGLGLGALDVTTADGTNGWAMAGLARVGFEYSLSLDGADARFGAGVMAGLVGPADKVASNAPVFGAMNATFSIGF